MILDAKTILDMIKRKGITLVAGMALGAVACVESPDIYAMVQKAVVVVGGTGGGALVLSMILSWLNERDKEMARIEALNTEPPK
jgi:hypothetical protein